MQYESIYMSFFFLKKKKDTHCLREPILSKQFLRLLMLLRFECNLSELEGTGSCFQEQQARPSLVGEVCGQYLPLRSGASTSPYLVIVPHRLSLYYRDN